MQYKKFFRWAAAGFLLGSTAFAQGPTMNGGSADAKLNPSVTNGSSIGNIFSPSLYNGTANIAIPIYSFDAYGVSLGYNTAGIRVSELAGPAGLHWNINASGFIVRQVKDVPDEMNSNPPIVMMPGGGVAGLGSGVYAVGLKGKFAQYFGITPASENPGRYTDGESDDFMFSAGGLSFTFNIGSDGFVFTHPHTNIKIQLLINGSPVNQIPVQSDESSGFKQNLSFIITDASGNRYYFEEGDVNEMSYSDGMRTNSGEALTINYVSRWVVSKIVRADGSEINYQYTTQGQSTGGLMLNAYSGLEKSGAAPQVVGQAVNIGGDIVSSKRLDQIRYPNNVTASFIYSSIPRCDNMRDARLEEIRIASDEQCMRYVMRQEYRIAAPSTAGPLPATATGSSCYNMGAGVSNNELYHRLVLKGIDMVSCDGSLTEPYYSFEYDAQRLPSRSSGAQDYFGYYNGQAVTANGGQLTVPLHTPVIGSGSAYGVNKADNASYAKAGLIQTVKNAYGGRLDIAYGDHSLSNVLTGLPSDALFMGSTANDGVKVASMTTSDNYHPGLYIRQSYTYTGGQRFLTGGYFHYPLWTGADNMLFSGSYVTPHQLVNGSNHGYSGVTVETRNEAGQLLSKRDITFSNLSTAGVSAYYLNGSKHYYEQPYTDKQYIKDWMLGLTLSVTEYDQNSLIKNKTVNSYFDYSDISSAAGKVENVKKLNVVADNGDLTPIAAENYRPYTGLARLISTTVQKYTSSTNYVSDVVSYDYDDHNNLLLTTTRNSRGQYSYVRNVYNYQVSGPGISGGGTSGTLYDMTAAGLEKLVSVERWKSGAAGTTPYSDQLLDASITKYNYNAATGRLYTQKAYALQRLSPVSYTEYTGLSMGSPSYSNPFGRILTAYSAAAPADFKATTEVTQKDNIGNTTEMKMLDLNNYMAMLWDRYGNMVASVQNARLADIAFTSFESDVYNDPAIYTGNEVIENGRISYVKNGIQYPASRISGKAVYRLNATNYIKCPALTNGKRYTITFWARDGVPVLDGGGTNSWTPAALYTANGWSFYKVDFTGAPGQVRFYAGSPLSVDDVRVFPEDAVMTSSVYTPLFGASSNTDASGRVVSYEYDLFGRQVIIRNQEGAILSKKEYHIAP